jgi:hypothetical protein
MGIISLAADRTTPFEETLQAIDDAYKAGKFKTFAISNFTAAEVRTRSTTSIESFYLTDPRKRLQKCAPSVNTGDSFDPRCIKVPTTLSTELLNTISCLPFADMD